MVEFVVEFTLLMIAISWVADKLISMSWAASEYLFPNK